MSIGHPFDLLMAGLDGSPERLCERVLDAAGRWRACGGSIEFGRLLGLPASPEGYRRELRNHWLRKAFNAADGATPEDRYAEIAHEIARSERYRSWLRRGAAPAHATAMQMCVFEAHRSGAEMPGTAKWLRRIVLGTNSGEIVPDEADSVGAYIPRRAHRHDSANQ